LFSPGKIREELTVASYGRRLVFMADLSEQAALRQLEERLTSKYAAIPAERVVSAIHSAYREFEAVPIRDFVPLFVERRAQAELGRA
jgi:hypothetical protein